MCLLLCVPSTTLSVIHEGKDTEESVVIQYGLPLRAGHYLCPLPTLKQGSHHWDKMKKALEKCCTAPRLSWLHCTEHLNVTKRVALVFKCVYHNMKKKMNDVPWDLYSYFLSIYFSTENYKHVKITIKQVIWLVWSNQNNKLPTWMNRPHF